ncbi:MAG: tight adherence protein B [Acidimicrobiaceae bacterium]|nr:MAG: tight adherence protein B [Acidimicrobiaceae bacterium]
MIGSAVIGSVVFGTLAAAALAAGLAFAPAPRREPSRANELLRSPHPTDDVVELLDDISRDIRSGLSLTAAVTAALAARPTVLPATASALGPVSGSDEALAAHAIRLAHRSGERADAVAEQAAGILRERRAWQHERHAQAAQARLSARVLTWLPIVFAAWGLATSSRVRLAYGSTPVTLWCTGAGIALNICGSWWMHRIIGGDRP